MDTMLTGLTGGQVLALLAIVQARVAWSRAEELLGAGVAADDLLALESAGWIESWDLPRCVAWTLTPWGAWRIRQELVEVGAAERPKWDECDPTRRSVVRAMPRGPAIQLNRPEFVVEHRPGPVEYLISLEEPEETTADASKAEHMMGVPILVDKRAKRKKEAARRKRRRRVAAR